MIVARETVNLVSHMQAAGTGAAQPAILVNTLQVQHE
jgi:hypothetical protein